MQKTQTLAALALALSVLPSSAFGQQEGEEPRAGAMNVYLDCEGARRACQSSHFRTEITFVNWVRDLADSQLHIIMTSSSTGSGDVFTMDFMGREELDGSDDQLTYSHSDTDSDDQRSQGITGLLAVGLARYSVLLGQTGPFIVNTPDDRERRLELPPGLQGDVDDPWDYWVFRVGGNVKYEDEDRSDEKSFSANFSANRTTEMWKISVSGRGSYANEVRVYSDLSEEGTAEEKDTGRGRLHVGKITNEGESVRWKKRAGRKPGSLIPTDLFSLPGYPGSGFCLKCPPTSDDSLRTHHHHRPTIQTGYSQRCCRWSRR